MTTLARAAAPQRIARPPAAWTPLVLLSVGVAVLLLAFAGRYGYHRDELYFLRAGRQPAFGYVDQPPLTPLLARAMDRLFPGSVTGLRVPSALAAGAVVLLTGLIAREFGGRRPAQLLAAACMAVGAFPLAVGHLLSTTTLDLLCWTALSWLLVRALRDGGPVWLVPGLVAGVGLENKWNPAFLVGAVVLGVLMMGPRRALVSPWPWLGGLLAVLLWLPNLVWQATHGWPQLELSRAIAAGSSGTSQPWYVFLPFQFLLISPVLAPIWVVGGWRLLRTPALRPWRAFPVAYLLLAALFVVTGGKPYYLGGLYPVLLAAGADPVVAWVARGSRRLRAAVLVAALVLSLAVSAFLFLPVVPVTRLAGTPIVGINYDAGETVGWPRFASTVGAVRERLPAGARVAVLTNNYGEAGAIDRYAPELGPAYSGHNSYAEWGPPPDDVTTVVAIGYSPEHLRAWFGQVQLAARIDDGVGLDNDEQDQPVCIASGPLRPWSSLWPQLRHFG